MGVAFVFFESTAALAALGLLGGVRALAGLTKGKVIFLSAAISSVPVTFTHVVEIVAITILLILGVFAVRLGRFRARGFRGGFLVFEAWVQTFAVLILGVAVFRTESTSAAIPAVPVAAADVVARVAKTVVFPRIGSAMPSFGAVLGTSARGTVFRVGLEFFVFTTALVAVVVAFAGATAIATVPLAATVVVAIIARLVALPLTFGTLAFAFRAVKFRIQALALAAVRHTSRAPTAVATIPPAATVVIVVVALFISLVRGNLAVRVAALHEFWFSFPVSLKASAFFAVFVGIFATVSTAAVAAVPITPTNIVAVIAYLVIGPCRFFAISCTAGFSFFRVEAFALRAYRVLIILAATIAPIPIAAAQIILVVAVTIPLVLCFEALAFTFA